MGKHKRLECLVDFLQGPAKRLARLWVAMRSVFLVCFFAPVVATAALWWHVLAEPVSKCHRCDELQEWQSLALFVQWIAFGLLLLGKESDTI